MSVLIQDYRRNVWVEKRLSDPRVHESYELFSSRYDISARVSRRLCINEPLSGHSSFTIYGIYVLGLLSWIFLERPVTAMVRNMSALSDHSVDNINLE